MSGYCPGAGDKLYLMLAGKQFILYGLSRLTVRVARRLAGQNAVLTIVCTPAETSLEPLIEGMGDVVRAREDREGQFREINLPGGAAFLALGEDDMENLRAAVAARTAAPDVPVVLRTFDPALAEGLEHGLGVRRAYSVSALASPAVVAAALDEEVLETMRLGTTEVPICRLTIRAGSPLAGISARELKRRYHCGVIARAPAARGATDPVGGDWAPVLDTDTLHSGDQVLVGGLLQNALQLARLNSLLFPARSLRRRPRPATRRSAARSGARSTLLPLAAAGFVLLIVASTALFQRALGLSWVDSAYFVVTTMSTTGYGDISLYHSAWWVKMVGILVMLSGAALLAVLFSYLASIATAERLDLQMAQKARRLSGHVVLCGLGKLGYRVAGHFIDLGIPLAVLDPSPNPRFVDMIRRRVPLLSGDARFPESLESASVASAVVMVACTNDDLANVQACLHARRLNPGIRTVARLFDEGLASRLTDVFPIDAAVSSTAAAVSAFVGAAIGEHALRDFGVGKLRLLAFRYDARQSISLETIQEWRSRGIRVLGILRAGLTEQAPSALSEPLQPGDQAILCGPAEAIRALLG